MKFHSLFAHILIFTAVFFAFIFPPILTVFVSVQSGVDFISWNFPFQQLCYFICAVFIYIFFPELKNTKNIYSGNKKFFYIFYNIFTPFLFTFMLLFFNSLVFSYLSTISIFKNTKSISVDLPQNFKKWIFCLLNFGFSAFYEEVIYRFYFIEELNYIFNKKQSKILKIIFEIITGALFAFSHFYLGLLSVINAALAHLILRFCYKKSGNIYCGFLSHFAYNIVSLILL